MKKLPGLLIGLMGMVLVTACSNEADEKMQQRKDGMNISDIALIEQSLGVPLFKVDKVLTDNDGNTVTIRFASLNKELLDEYVKGTKYSVTFTTSAEKLTRPPQTPLNAQIPETTTTAEVGYDQKIVIETISRSVRKGVTGYVVHVEQTGYSASNGKVARDGWWVEHTSEPWPEEIWMWNYTAEYIHYKLYRKWNWSDVTWGSYFIINNFTAPSAMENVDGPWKVRLNLEYDHSTGSYDFRWYDAELDTFYQTL